MNGKTIIENEDRVTVEVSTELGYSGAKVLCVKIGGFVVKHRISENFGEHILIFRKGMKPLTDPSVDDKTIGMFEKTTEEHLFPKILTATEKMRALVSSGECANMKEARIYLVDMGEI